MTNFNFLDSDDFNDALSEQKVKLFINPGMPNITWDEILEFVNNHKQERVGWKILPSSQAFFRSEEHTSELQSH